LQQISGGVATRYALDLNNDLAQILSDGSNTYLYGPSTGSGWRIAQQNIVGRQYYLGDALGSVRQLVNPIGAVILARSYEPFGKQLSTAGNPLTKYGYTGEWTNPTNLVYLRARYYDPATGRFLSKDPVKGLLALPQTIHPYLYVVNNAINMTDPASEFIPVWAITGGIGFVTGIGGYLLGQYFTYGNLSCVNITDALLAGGIGLVTGLIWPFAQSGASVSFLYGTANVVQYWIHQRVLHDEKFSWGVALGQFASGALSGLITGLLPLNTKWDVLSESTTRDYLINWALSESAFALTSLIRSFLGATISNFTSMFIP